MSKKVKAKRKFALILGSSILVIGVMIGCIIAGTSICFQKNGSSGVPNQNIDFDSIAGIDSIDRESAYSDFVVKTLTKTIEDNDEISDCKMDVKYSNGEVVSADVSVVTTNDKTDILETNILNYISEALEISTEDITLTFN